MALILIDSPHGLTVYTYPQGFDTDVGFKIRDFLSNKIVLGINDAE